MSRSLLVLKDKLSRGIVTVCPLWIKPNHLTWLRLILVIPLFLFLIYGKFIFALIIFFFALLTDFIDGSLARIRGKETLFGQILDGIADKSIFLTIFIFLGVHSLDLTLFTLLLSCEVSVVLTGLILAPLFYKLNLQKELRANIFGKIKSIFFAFGLIFLFLNIYLSNFVFWAKIFFWLAICFTLISLGYHVFKRMRYLWRRVRSG